MFKKEKKPIGLDVIYARQIREAMKRHEKEMKSKEGSFGKKVVTTVLLSAIGAGIAYVAMRKKKEEPPQIPAGTPKQVDVAKRQGELPPEVLKQVEANPKINPFSLKEREK
ncbi:MAG: hypothetical protein N3G22_00625 [Candidatus Micrarchaeota archaeon]|nr:hypothetical protein [Candidatus Micrarchaeota archaeon]